MSPLERRAKAAQATLDHFRGKPFKLGTRDCGRMVDYQLKRLGVRVKAPAAGSYRTAIAAKRELNKLGYKSLADLLDTHFERIPPAAALVGDVIEMPGAEGLSGLAIALGNGRVVAYHEDCDGAEVLQPLMMSAAWRVL